MYEGEGGAGGAGHRHELGSVPLVPLGHSSPLGTSPFLFNGLQISTVYDVLLWLGGCRSVVTTECGPPSFSRLKSVLSTRTWSQLKATAEACAARRAVMSRICIFAGAICLSLDGGCRKEAIARVPGAMNRRFVVSWLRGARRSLRLFSVPRFLSSRRNSRDEQRLRRTQAKERA